MTSPSSSQMPYLQSATPFFPGGWPSPSEEAHDADLSTATYPIASDNRSESDNVNEKTQRRWTFSGSTVSIPAVSTPVTPTSPDFKPLTASTSHNSRMSQLTENTLSSAASSALNTPDLARWSQLPAGADERYLDGSSGGERVSPRQGMDLRFGRDAPSPLHGRFASPYLDPPLLNIVPGLPPLKSAPAQASSFGYHDSPPTSSPPHLDFELYPAPASLGIPSLGEALPPTHLRSHNILAPPRVASDFFPVIELTPDPSPQLTIASLPTSLYVSDADSHVLPSSDNDGIDPVPRPQPAFMHLSPSASDMDAFALAAAVALSTSRTSLAIPPSIQSVAASEDRLSQFDSLCAPTSRRQPSRTDASVGHRVKEAVGATGVSEHGLITSRMAGSSRMRRRSAPTPSAARSPRPATARLISSRVDVGDRIPMKKQKPIKQPVLGKVRRFGQRIRGLFKSKGDSPTKHKEKDHDRSTHFGLMTTTTAITNVEFESEHPIPLPSPRAKIMRNYRRSLPVPSLLLPSSADNIASVLLKRPSASRTNTNSSSALSRSGFDGAQVNVNHTEAATGPSQSPHTPRPLRHRTQTTPHTCHDEEAEGKARRFSLSSALSKTRLETIRSTVMPRPPLPIAHPRNTYENGPSAALSRNSTHRSSFGRSRRSPSSDHVSPSGDYWGAELPSVKIIRDSQDVSREDTPPRRSRTHTAPSGPQVSPSGATITTPKAKRLRRFSLSSILAKRSSRSRVVMGGVEEDRVPDVPVIPASAFIGNRPRGDTITTVTQGVPFDLVQPRQGLELLPRPHMPTRARSNRGSLISSAASSHGGSAYFDAYEQFSEDHYQTSFEADRSCSPGPESDLDSMSFARTPDYSSGTFSFGSTERNRSADAERVSIPGSYTFRSDYVGRCASTSAISRLVGEPASTPVTKTLRFSPSLSLSFERSWSDGEDDDELGGVEQEEERGFMRALGFEFDEIARRMRDDSL
ncbi:hypothetical protein C8Q70DRAFT_1043125 [Cubamyces menziesii]|nr:hypothetical protein C8Q70DRAFT_1043125 [Cubamyces menziesii]